MVAKKNMRNANTCQNRWACTASAWLILIGLVLGVVWAANAQKTAPSKRKPPIRQGICGTVTELRGNQMPQVTADGKPAKKSSGKPVIREVVIYPAFTIQQAEMAEDGFIRTVQGLKPIKTTKSDKYGNFCVYGLPVGQYSVLIQEPQGLYATIFDGKNRVNPVVVTKNRLTQTNVSITHRAVF